MMLAGLGVMRLLGMLMMIPRVMRFDHREKEREFRTGNNSKK
jgi:hypothetical protein